MAKLDKLMILVMEELDERGYSYNHTDKLRIEIESFGTTITIRYSESADCFFINNSVVFHNVKNERSRLITTGAIIQEFLKTINELAGEYLENNLRESTITEDAEETPNTENVSRVTSHTADTGNYTQESSITPITPKFTDEEINNELSKVEMRLEDLLYKELETYTFKYKQYKQYHTTQIVVAFILDDKMFSINFVTKPNSLDGNVTVTGVFTDEILYEREYLCFNIDNYHRSICSIFYHIVRKIKRNDLNDYRKINL